MATQLTFWELEDEQEVCLHIYNNDIDYIIADSPQEALEIMMSESGLDAEEAGTFVIYPDDRDFTMRGFNEKIIKTAREWCVEHGKGYFACSEW